MPLSIQKLSELFQSEVSGAFMVLDQSDQLIYCHPALNECLGYDEEQLRSLPLHKWVTLADSGAIFKTKDGVNITSRYVTTSIVTRDGHVKEEYEFIMLRDIPGPKHSALMVQFMDMFMKDINLGVLLINQKFELVDISEMACRILGFNKEVVVGKPLEEVFHDVPKEHQLVQRTLLDGVVVRNHAVSWTNQAERFELLMDSSFFKNERGDTVGAYVIFKDVSNTRSLEEQVQRSDRLAMIGQIAAGAAHEIRNPLTSIKGFLQVLKKTTTEREMRKESGYIDIMLGEIDRINGLVSEFLLLSKPKDTTFYKVDLSTIIQEIMPIINSEAILHNVSVQYEPAKELPEVVTDRELLKQVFLNICKNGIEAMGEEGTLTIHEHFDAAEQKVTVDIRDTGPGIPAFLIDKIFDPFFTTKDEGIGLGLSVCQRIIHDMGGSIRVNSKGFGTTFHITLPHAK